MDSRERYGSRAVRGVIDHRCKHAGFNLAMRNFSFNACRENRYPVDLGPRKLGHVDLEPVSYILGGIEMQAAFHFLAVVTLLPAFGADDNQIQPVVAEEEFQAARDWVLSQPQTFDNAVLFEQRNGELVRSSRYTAASQRFGDFDGDGDVDMHDYFALQICLSFSGPLIPTPPACQVFNSDGDNDIDLVDAAAFQNAMTGSLHGVLVEAGELMPVAASPDFGYYSGEPGQSFNNALHGIARQAGYSQDDLWYHWSIDARPAGSGAVFLSNSAMPATAYWVLPPLQTGTYLFSLKVTNLVTFEFGSDSVVLAVLECVSDWDCGDGDACTADTCDNYVCAHTNIAACCRADADCDDGIFCNGLERCINNVCSDHYDPCPGCGACDEEAQTCLSVTSRSTLEFENATSVDEQLLSYLSSEAGGGLALTEWERSTLRPLVRLRLAILFADGTSTNVVLSAGSGDLFQRALDPLACPDLGNYWDTLTLGCSPEIVDIRATDVEVFVPVPLTGYELMEVLQPDGSTTLEWRPRTLTPPQFRALQLDEVDSDGNVVLRRNIGVRDFPEPIAHVSCDQHFRITMRGVLSVPFLLGAPGYDQGDWATVASIGGRFEFITGSNPRASDANVFVYATNGLSLPAEFIVTIERDVPLRDARGKFLLDTGGNVRVSPQRQTARLPIPPLEGIGSGYPNLPEFRVGAYFDCGQWAVRVVGLGENWMPDDPAVILGSGPERYGLPVGDLRPLLLDYRNFGCGDIVVFATVVDPLVPSGAGLRSFLVPVVEQPCNDQDFCTRDICDSNVCVHYPVECSPTERCVNGDCVGVCNFQFACDDGRFCNGLEQCDPVTEACFAGVPPCDAQTQVCDELNRRCTPPCSADTDCDDNDVCTTDTCDMTTHLCTQTPKDCNDGVACTVDACDAATGDCTHTDNCPADETCNTTLGLCEAGVACTVPTQATDCPDDGLFCNGTEVCDPAVFICRHSGDPCVAPQICNEDQDLCDECFGGTIQLTLGIDNLSGSECQEIFYAPLIFNPPTGTLISSLQTGDILNGVGGVDVLNVMFNSTAATTVQPTIAHIPTFNSTDFGSTTSTTFSCVNTTGVATINSTNGTNTFPLVFTNVPNVVNVGLTNTNAGMTVTYATAATAGVADAMTATLSNATAGTLTIKSTGPNGIESLRIVSIGAANTLAALNQTTGTSLRTITIRGDQNLTITAALPAGISTIDALTMTGNTQLTVSATAANVVYSGGTGNDIVLFGSTYTSADIINGGSGTDTLGLNSAQAVVTSTQSNVSDFETIRVQDQLSGALALPYFGSTVRNAWLSAGAAHGSVIVMPALGATGGKVAINNSDNAGALGITVSGSGTADVLNLDLLNADMGGMLAVTGAETVNLLSGIGSEETAADGGENTATTVVLVPTAGTATLNISGSVPFTMSGYICADTINASTFTAALTMGTNVVAAGSTNVVVTGGSGNDTLYGGPGVGDMISGGAGNDNIIILGAGTDTGAANQGDVLSGGSGSNIFKFQASTLANLCATSAGTTRTVRIIDFDASMDKIALVNDAAYQTSLTLATGQSIAASSLTDVFANMTAISASVSGGPTYAVLITITSGMLSGNKYLYVNNATAGVSNSADMLIELTGMTGTLSSSNFQFN